MSKQNKKVALAFKDASAQLIKKVEGVMAEATKHTFSVSRVYAAHNEVFQLNEKPQTCGSCLRTRANNLAKWYNEANKGKLKAVPTTGVMQDPPAQDEPPVVDTTENLIVSFTPAEEGAQYGIATLADGTPAPAGNYHQDDQQFAVNGDAGNYTVITGEPAGDEAKFKAEGITVLKLKEEGGQDIHFTTEDKSAAVLGSKGLVKYADGSNVKTGKHELADGTTLAVAVGGKAAIKE